MDEPRMFQIIRNTSISNIYLLNETVFNETIISTSQSPLKIAADFSVKITLILVMLGMGNTVEIKILIGHLRRPIGIAIGMLSQFVVLPAVTFGLAHALQLPPIPALGMLVIGCCPGGTTTNVFSYWTDGDVALSISMTAVSTVLAMGMLPLNLLIYSRSWTDQPLIIPYVNILISFGLTLGPALLGIFIRWKFPKVADVLVKVGSVAGALAILLLLTLLSIQYPFMYHSTWRIYIGTLILPFAGFLFGYLVALLLRQDHVRCRTIALETGIQNFPLCMSLLTLTYSNDVFAEISLFPLLYGVTCILCSLVFLGIYRLVERMKQYSKYNKSSSTDTPEDKAVNSALEIKSDNVEIRL
ncbi:SLC10A2 [Mytilus coruscus]|uniref:SLC10A2 n=1 Tax=Mytilus coruscus TaxID=42192 RepID=A0A6J8F0D0_MYTCO|nr:SLC10A2 [Mytilus coruscus]